MGVLARLERLFAERDLRELLDRQGDGVAPADFFEAEEVLAHDRTGAALALAVGDGVTGDDTGLPERHEALGERLVTAQALEILKRDAKLLENAQRLADLTKSGLPQTTILRL